VSNGGSRTAMTGYNQSVAYVVDSLASNTNFIITQQLFYYPYFIQVDTPQLREVSPSQVSYVNMADFRNLNLGGNGNNTAFVTYVGGGCFAENFTSAGFQVGQIALMDRAYLLDCALQQKVNNAIAANASGVLVSYDPVTTGLFQSGLTSMPPFPAFSVTYDLGQTLKQIINLEMTLYGNNTATMTPTFNVIADTTDGDPSNVIVVGSHLDSVIAGAGINDNGSGSSVNLELAIQFYKQKIAHKNKVRFCWWGAEESGLLGSQFYVSNLTSNAPGELANIALNLNFDMLGSPNYYYGIYNGSSGSANIKQGSTKIQELFEVFFITSALPYELSPFTGRSDYGPFISVGIPAGGLAAGAEVIKSAAQRTTFGGFANAAFDPCYHQYCDNINNVDNTSLSTMSRAAATVLQQLADQNSLHDWLNSPSI